MVVTTQRTVVVGQLPEERVIEEGGKDNDPTKATDDLHLTKFKKQLVLFVESNGGRGEFRNQFL